MRFKLLFLHIPIVFLFTLLFVITELGSQGTIRNETLREGVYRPLSRAISAMTDLKFKSRGPRPPKNKIVVVEIDSPALDAFGRWPWHRDTVALLIDKIFQAGAKVVGLDIIFSEEDRRIPEGLVKLLSSKKLEKLVTPFETDIKLKTVIEKYSEHLVLGFGTESACQPALSSIEECPVDNLQAIEELPINTQKFAYDQFDSGPSFDRVQTGLMSLVTMISNLPMYNQVAKNEGYLNSFPDADGYFRKSQLLILANGLPYAPLPLIMAKVGLREKLQVSLDHSGRVAALGFMRSKRNIPVNALGTMDINFRGPSRAFPYLSATDVLKEDDTIEDPLNRKLTGQSKSQLLKDSYVLIGLTALGIYDMRSFPFDVNAPGVDGHAHILDNILSGDPMSPSAGPFEFTSVFILMTLGILMFCFVIEKLGSIGAVAFFFISFFGIYFFDFKVLINNNLNWNTCFLYLEITASFISVLIAKYILEEKNKKFIRSAFSKYVSPAIVDSILNDPTKLSLNGEKREVTILFSDIRGFTSFSENMDAKVLASFLNEYLGLMTEIIFKNGGTLDKYIGDAVMAFWGAPLGQTEHALNASLAALEMLKVLHQNQVKFQEKYGIVVDVGIGINSGLVNVGNLGSEKNFAYTVIGDQVNLASRLEGITKKYKARIVMSKNTLDSILVSGKMCPPHRKLDEIKVKGKKEKIEIYQLLEKSDPIEGAKLFQKARELYLNQKWDLAKEVFLQAQKHLSLNEQQLDGPCEIFIERCEFLRNQPPFVNWDGSWEMDSK